MSLLGTAAVLDSRIFLSLPSVRTSQGRVFSNVILVICNVKYNTYEKALDSTLSDSQLALENAVQRVIRALVVRRANCGGTWAPSAQ